MNIKEIVIQKLGGFTREQIEEVLDEEIELTQKAEYYKITNNENGRADIVRKIRFIGWKIFTRFGYAADPKKYW